MKHHHIDLQQEAWFKSWFDSMHYHKLYQDRSETEASEFVDTLLHFLQPFTGAAMLDLACGTGRHSRRMASGGFRVTGLDLARSSIQQARKWANSRLRFAQHDMREPFGTNRYDYIFNFFTSFGYFDAKAENNTVVNNIACALKQNGIVVFDYLNVPYAEKNLVQVEEKEIDGTVYHINRWSSDRFLYKRIAIQEGSGAQPLEYIEKVARFTLADFEKFFAASGLVTEHVFGDYALFPYDAKSSKRLNIIARKLV